MVVSICWQRRKGKEQKLLGVNITMIKKNVDCMQAKYSVTDLKFTKGGNFKYLIKEMIVVIYLHLLFPYCAHTWNHHILNCVRNYK